MENKELKKPEEEKSKIEGLKKDIKVENKESEKTEEKTSEANPETKPVEKKEVSKVKKENAVINIKSAPVSTKYSKNICKFIKNKTIEKAIKDLEEVLLHKKVIPMKGEYAHRKGKGIGPGKYPKQATEHFIKFLKSLSANANVNNLDNPIIKETCSNIASRPRGRFGKWQRKRTHITIIACEKNQNKKTKIGSKK